MSTTDTLDDDHPLSLVNEQIKGLLEGVGASEDHGDVLTFLRNTGLPEGTVARMHKAIVCAENSTRWPILSDGHLRAICFAYEKGYAAGLDERNTCNVFGASGSQAAAFDVGLECGRAARSRVKPAPSFADAYQGAMEESAIWKKRALEAEDLNRKFLAEINSPTHMGEPAQPATSVPDGWQLVPIEPTTDMLCEMERQWFGSQIDMAKREWKAALAVSPSYGEDNGSF